MTKFFSLPNLATDKVEVIEEPWNVRVDPAVLALTKTDYKKRWSNPETRHYLLTMAEGQNADYIVSAGNQASGLYGFMADYDGALTDDWIETIMKKPQSRWSPAWWCRSQSGKLHLVWMFERRMSVTGNRHASELLKIIARKIKAPCWGVGYDPSCETVTQVMDIGSEWKPFREGSRIPNEEIVLWDSTIFEKTAKAYVQDVVDIPFDVVVDAIKTRTWPVQPPLDIRIGTRCVRFWDPSADNTTGAQFTKDGIRVYTPHDNGFKSWRSLLGPEFCEQYTAKSQAPFLEDTYYCHTKDEYWRFFRSDTTPHYEKRTEKVLRRDLVIEARLSPKPPKGETMSEVDNLLHLISRKNCVDAVAPILYRKSGRIEIPGSGSVLNTSNVVVTAPAPRLAVVTPEDLAKYPRCPSEYKADPSVCRWDNPFAVSGFPHVHRLLTAMFMKNTSAYRAWRDCGFELHDPSGRPLPQLCDGQLMRLLSWTAHFYVNSGRMYKNPGRGQALILAGPHGVGKSFFARYVLGRLMGGVKDAESFYLNGNRFNSDIVSYPVHLIDDRLGSPSHRDRLRFTEAMKFVVANAVIRYEAKFGSAMSTIPWPGRIVVAANEDVQSLSVLPDLDMSTRDKFMMLKLGGARFDWGSDSENASWLDQELPYFARFLLGWEIPVEMRDERFGVAAMQHSDMAQASAENGLTQVLVEVLETCIGEVTGSRDDKDLEDAEGWVVEGPAVKIFKWIKSVDDALAREVVDSRTLNQSLTTLYRNGAYNIQLDEATHRWRIPYVLRRKIEKHG